MFFDVYIKCSLVWKAYIKLMRTSGHMGVWHRNSQFTNIGKYATISKEAET